MKLGLEIRSKEKVPVRQTLSDLVITGTSLDPAYLDFVKDELNVKNIVVVDGESLSLELNTEITPDLRLEGICRELIRHLNNCRKRRKLSFGQRINLFIEADNPEIHECLKRFGDRVMASVQVDMIVESIVDCQQHEEISMHDSKIKVAIELV